MFALWLASRAIAADVLVPACTPASVSDFSVAYMISDLVVNALEDKGVAVEDDSAIKRWASDAAVGCFDNADCPANLFERSDARVAVVLGVTVIEDGFEIEARILPAGAYPSRVLRETVPSGQETRFAQRVAMAVVQMLPDLPAREGAAPEEEAEEPTRIPPRPTARPVEPDPEEEEDAPRPTTKAPTEERPTTKSTGTRPVVKGVDDVAPKDLTEAALRRDARAKVEQAQLGLPWGTYTKYRQSGQKWSEWRKTALVRQGRVWLALGGGMSWGDLGRVWSVREYVDLDGDQLELMGEASHYGVSQGSGASFGGEVGYAPAWWAEVDVWVGGQVATKSMDSGWECFEGCTAPTASNPYGTVDAMQLWVEPRFKAVLLPTGYVKPHVLVGAAVVGSDGFIVPDGQSALDYPDQPATFALGPTGGVGVGIDPIPNLGITLEGTYTYFLSGAEEDKGDFSQFSIPPDDYGGSMPGVVRASLLIGARL